MNNANIHLLANVHPNAAIGKGTQIGAFTSIEEDVSIGKDCTIATGVTIKNGSVLGNNNAVYENVVIGGNPQDLMFDPKTKSGVIIGNNNTLREGVTIHRATIENNSTSLGNDNYLMAQSHLAHDCQVHNKVIIANNTLLAGHVKVFSWAFISGSCAVHQNTRIGHLSMVSGLSGVSKDVPPGATVSGHKARFFGINLVGMRRLGLPASCRKELRNFYEKFYKLSNEEFHAFWQAELASHSAITDKTESDELLLKNANIEYLSNPIGILHLAHSFIKTSNRNIVFHSKMARVDSANLL